MSFSVKRFSPEAARAVAPPGMAGADVLGIYCPHLEKPLLAIFRTRLPPALCAEMEAMGFPVPDEAPANPLTFEQMARQAVTGFREQLTCGCDAVFWMRHGEPLALCAEDAAFSTN